MQSSAYYKIGQLVLAILGMAFSLGSGCSGCVLLVVSYALATIYLLMIIIQDLTHKHAISSSFQLVSEIVLAILILGFSIYFITVSNKDTLIILAIVVGFILPALFFLTAFEKM